MSAERVLLGLKRPCPACGKLVSVYCPAFAAASGARIFRKHRRSDVANGRCVGSHAPEEPRPKS